MHRALRQKMRLFCLLALGLGLAGLTAGLAAAQTLRPDMAKLAGTGGVMQIEGAGGGGMTPWALITGYGSRDSWGASVHTTTLGTQDYRLTSKGVAFGFADRLELSFAAQDFHGSLAPLNALRIRQNVVGIKLRIAGDAIVDQDNWMPQLAVGVMSKRNMGVVGLAALGVNNVRQLGAKDDRGVDYYLSATKLLLNESLLLNGTLRATKANQLGLLGFGGDKGDSYQAMLETSAAYLVTRKLVIGAEYRMKPNNLGVDNEKAYGDIFVAYFPTKNLSLTLAYATLGDITVFNPKRQNGAYMSLQLGF